MRPKLNQIIAVEKGVKSRTEKTITALHRQSQQPTLFNGFKKSYVPKDEEGERFPDEDLRVQFNALDSLESLGAALGELFDNTLTKDRGNQKATADITVDGELVLSNVPPTFLLFLEKQLVNVRTFVANLPELDAANDWETDSKQRIYRTDPVRTIKTRKEQKPVVLYDATEKHPAQTQLITQDVTVGYWDTVKLSGALAPEKKKAILDRVDALQKAVKVAREEANGTEIDRAKAGEALMGFILGDNK